jgi:GT2 family glycosyltransferase
MSLSIIIPTWNNADLTLRCLAALAEHTRHDFEVIWIDNGSSDSEHLRVKNALQGFSYQQRRYPEPLGFARATNAGLPLVRGDYCVFMNNDVSVCPNWDEDLRLAVDDQPGIAGPLTINSIGWQSSHCHPWLGLPSEIQHDNRATAEWLDSQWRHTVIDIPEQPTLPNFRDMLAFFCVLMPNSVQQKIGALDENFGWGYCEDDDYCYRARAAGFHLSLCPGSQVEHSVGQTLGQLNDDHSARLAANRAYLAEKWPNIGEKP